MRIPSQFNEDNLYRRRNRRVDTTGSHRRLARLVIALALVIVFMRQAGRPEVYEAFFGDPAGQGVPPDPRGVPISGVTIEEPAEIELDAETRMIANHLTGSLTPSEQLQWLATLTRWQNSRAIEAVPATIDATLDRLEAMDDVAEERKIAWREMIESLQADVSSQGVPATAESGDQSELAAKAQLTGWIKALDDAAANRVVDGSVWQSTDFDAFYRFLDQAAGLSEAGVVSTGVLPLLQQPDVYRNQRIRFAGTVARAEQVEATDNPFGIERYWRLWLRPRGGADRPLLAIVPAVPQAVASVGAEALELEGPAVSLLGRFLKRLPYRSSLGADLTPVVIGRLVTVPVPEAGLAVSPSGDNTPGTPSKFWLIVAVASAVGFLLAATVMSRTSAMEKRARELRASHRHEPNEFLDELRSATDETPLANTLEDNPRS